MEGRQAAIIVHCLRGASQAARAVLEESTPTEPWEQQVAACLRVMCANADEEAALGVTTMVEHFLKHKPIPGYAVLRARLGLTVAILWTRCRRTAGTAAQHADLLGEDRK
ncbi:hypothetical protein ETD86_18990 [Nonomuraea turkmeniaca]|uniref:Uncharacterized protein n=1 Tax=Nonomuraea turkmeniaca TaxID=103838 RepID=A0A5S4FIA7_9ACTN|nr:hypothetical protein [Nonomuraea turkmeniaca]TMR20258.1 hypothetical protein ETD86_18990 [Nonomuraea turkmeniaca]